MQALTMCIYRELSIPTFQAIVNLVASRANWRILMEGGDALISRSRSIAATQWLLNYPNDDVLVMTDDDFYFTADGLNALADLAREKKGIAAGVTPLRSGEFAAVVPLDGVETMYIHEGADVQQIKWAGGLIAYHRSVFEKMAETMPLLHKNDSIAAFYPFFDPSIYEHPKKGPIYLSEDYACHERARQLGFTVWVQPKCQVGHLAQILVTPQNMSKVREFHK